MVDILSPFQPGKYRPMMRFNDVTSLLEIYRPRRFQDMRQAFVTLPRNTRFEKLRAVMPRGIAE
jgi:hypothetical protein